MPGRKITSLITVILFVTQTAAYSAPVSLVTAPLQENSSFALPLDLPQSLGSVEETYAAPENSVTLIHIQDAHGSYEAQKNIRDILRTLAEQHKIKLIFVEGAQTALDPNLFHFFEDPSLNLKAADTLMRHGEFSGAEMFLLEQSFLKNKGTLRRLKLRASASVPEPRGSGLTTGYGIEQPDLYRHDLILFRKIMNKNETAAQFMAGLLLQTQILEDPIFTKELNTFMNAWKRHNEGGELLRYAGFLAKQAAKHLDLNLRDPANQDTYPVLIRMLQLKKVQSGLDSGKIEKEKAAILEALKSKLDTESYENLKALGSPASEKSRTNPRYLLEKIAEQAKDSGFSFTNYPHFSLFAACLIFKHEITSQQLFKEMDSLADQLFEVLPKTVAEKELLLLVRNLAKLKKLFSLELSREEYESVQKAPYAFKPSILIEKIQELAAGSRSKVSPWADSQKSDADSRFEEALEFYRLAKERENFFLEKTLGEMEKRHETKAVLITGGFHTQGLQEIMKQKGISYALVSPKLSDAKESRDHYLKAMMGINERPEAAIDESQIALFMQLLPYAAQQNLAEKNHLDARTRFAAMVLLNLAHRHGKLAELRRIAAKTPQYSPYFTAASLGDENVTVQQAVKAVEETVPGLLRAHAQNTTPENFIRSNETAAFWRALHQLVMRKDRPSEKDIASSGLPAWTHERWQLFILDDRLDFAIRVDMGDTSYKFLEQKILELVLKINPQAAVLAPIAQRIPQPPKPRQKTYTRRSAMGTTGGNEYFETWLGWHTIRTQDDEQLMKVIEYIKRGEDIPEEEQRLPLRQVANRSQVRMFTVINPRKITPPQAPKKASG